jgi:hypothetical protein
MYFICISFSDCRAPGWVRVHRYVGARKGFSTSIEKKYFVPAGPGYLQSGRYLDRRGFLGETAGVNRPFLSLALAICSGGFVAAQQPADSVPFSAASEPHLSQPKIDLAKIESGMSAAYYHPDDLSGMDCGATIGWADVMKQLKQEVPPDRLKVLDGMNVEMNARRGKSTEVKITWANGEPTNKQTLEDGTKQMIGGFFQTYWPIAGASMAPAKSDTVHVEARDGGGYTLHTNSAGTVVTEEVDRDLVPIKINVNSPAMIVGMVPHFTPSPNPVAGDLRWLTGLDVTTRIGTSTTNAGFTIEYQTIGGYHIPQRFSINVGGAYSVPVELIGCSVSKDVIVAPPTK